MYYFIYVKIITTINNNKNTNINKQIQLMQTNYIQMKITKSTTIKTLQPVKTLM